MLAMPITASGFSVAANALASPINPLWGDTHKSDQAFSVAPISGVGGSGQIFASGFGTPSVREH
jgi:hypothetical protein